MTDVIDRLEGVSRRTTHSRAYTIEITERTTEDDFTNMLRVLMMEYADKTGRELQELKHIESQFAYADFLSLRFTERN